MDLFTLDKYGLSGYNRLTWGDIRLNNMKDMDAEQLRRFFLDFGEIGLRFLKIERNSKNSNREKEKGLSKYDINAKTSYDNIASDFYKTANRIYIAHTANSRVALYEHEGKYYLSERRVMITDDAYNIMMIDGYSKQDELFTEVSEDEIKAIFGEKSRAILKYGNNLDTALFDYAEMERIGCSKSYFWTIEDLIKLQQDVTEIPEPEVPKQQAQVDSGDLAQLSKEMGITTSEVRENGFTKLWRALKERISGR